jgi:DNA-binding GntR family transcriptional regulator
MTAKTPQSSDVNKEIDEFSRLRDMIWSEELMPKQRLVEQEFAERFGTSRANIRKAFSRLEQEGLIVLEPFRGAHVRHITAADAVEMYEIRGALEVMLMQHVCERISEVDKKILKQHVQKMREMLRSKDANAVASASRKLREEIWRISGHAAATKILAGLNTQLVRIWFRSRHLPGRAEAIVEELSAVVEAICEVAASKATKAMKTYHTAAIANLKVALSLDVRS